MTVRPRGASVLLLVLALLSMLILGACRSSGLDGDRSSVSSDAGPDSIPEPVLEAGGSGIYIAGDRVGGRGIVLASLDQRPIRLEAEPNQALPVQSSVLQIATIGYGEGREVITWITSNTEIDGFGTRVPLSSTLPVPNETVHGRPAVLAGLDGGGTSVSWEEPDTFAWVTVSSIDPAVDVVAVAESTWSLSAASFRALRDRTPVQSGLVMPPR